METPENKTKIIKEKSPQGRMSNGPSNLAAPGSRLATSNYPEAHASDSNPNCTRYCTPTSVAETPNPNVVPAPTLFPAAIPPYGYPCDAHFSSDGVISPPPMKGRTRSYGSRKHPMEVYVGVVVYGMNFHRSICQLVLPHI
jgi:hypothetical protein